MHTSHRLSVIVMEGIFNTDLLFSSRVMRRLVFKVYHKKNIENSNFGSVGLLENTEFFLAVNIKWRFKLTRSTRRCDTLLVYLLLILLSYCFSYCSHILHRIFVINPSPFTLIISMFSLNEYFPNVFS